jgi:HK97 family phage portal protein
MWPFKKAEQRDSIASSDPFLGQFLGARWQGRADIEKASGHSVAFSCIQTVSGALASVPLKLYQHQDDGGREPATSHPLYDVLSCTPNGYHTAFEARERLIADILMYGNAYAKIERNGRGQVTALYPLIAGQVWVDWMPNGKVRYQYTPLRGPTQVLLQDEVLHIRYRSHNGIWGISPIQAAASTFGLALAQEETAGNAAVNSFRPAGAVVFPEKLAAAGKGAGNVDDIVAKFKARFTGAMNANEVMVLDGGAKFETFQFNSKDSEFLASRQLSNSDVCRIFGVPPSVVGIAEHSNFGTAVEESRALVTRCLAPMAARIEQAMNIALLTPQSRQTLFIEHDLSGLLRGDMAARYSAYAVGRNNGWLSVNEIRNLENMSSIGKDGDTYAQPLNVGTLGAANDNNQNKIDTSPAAPSDNEGAAAA